MAHDQHVIDWSTACNEYIVGLWAWDDSAHLKCVLAWCQWNDLAEFDDDV